MVKVVAFWVVFGAGADLSAVRLQGLALDDPMISEVKARRTQGALKESLDIDELPCRSGRRRNLIS